MINRMMVALSILLFLILWQIVSMTDLPFIPSPATIFKTFITAEFWVTILPDFRATLIRIFLSLSGGMVIGVSLGLLMGYFPLVYAFFELPVDFFRSIPATAIFPLFMLFLGISDWSKIIVIVFYLSLVMMVHTSSGVRQGVVLRRMAARIMGANSFQIFTKIAFFDALPHIFTGLKICLSICMVLVIVLEMFIGTKNGLGKEIYDFHLTYQITYMYSVIILVGLTSYILNTLARFTEKYFIHWIGK